MTVHDYDKEIKIQIIGDDWETNKRIEAAFIYHIKKEIYNLKLRLVKTNYAIKTFTDYKKIIFKREDYYLNMFAIAVCENSSTLEHALLKFELYKKNYAKQHNDLLLNTFEIIIYPPNWERKLKIKQLGLI
jgi:hypothetical protein